QHLSSGPLDARPRRYYLSQVGFGYQVSGPTEGRPFSCPRCLTGREAFGSSGPPVDRPVTKANGKVVSTFTQVVSADGKTLTYTLKDAQGKPEGVVQVSDRQSTT